MDGYLHPRHILALHNTKSKREGGHLRAWLVYRVPSVCVHAAPWSNGSRPGVSSSAFPVSCCRLASSLVMKLKGWLEGPFTLQAQLKEEPLQLVGGIQCRVSRHMLPATAYAGSRCMCTRSQHMRVQTAVGWVWRRVRLGLRRGGLCLAGGRGKRCPPPLPPLDVTAPPS